MRQLSMIDGVSLIVGIVVGVSIFRVPNQVFGNVSEVWTGMIAWGLGGLLSLAGAMCYAELATTYPREGGDYVYLNRAYGPLFGFLFGWAQLAAILTGSIGAMAYTFADYAQPFFDLAKTLSWDRTTALDTKAILAAGVVILLTMVNLFGVSAGKWTQNALTLIKVVGLAAIVLAGIISGGSEVPPPTEPLDSGFGFGVAMILVLYAYGGWNDAAFVAAEIREPQKSIPRALILGVGFILLVYLLVNFAYVHVLGFEGVRSSRTPAADVMKAVGWTFRGFDAISLLVMFSALGALNGLILTGSRVYSALGKDHPVFAWLGRRNEAGRFPIWSMLAQAMVTLMMIVAVGTAYGRDRIDVALSYVGMSAIPWDDKFSGGFDALVAVTAPLFWSFFLLTGVALFVLRIKDRETPRPFRVPGFPVLPIAFCLMCIWMLNKSIAWVGGLAFVGVIPLLFGLPLFVMDRRIQRGENHPQADAPQ